jgi:tRNA(Ile2) C34 agmatinyltransferase TiaS
MPNTVAEKTTPCTDRCHRCGGLMVSEQVFEIRSIDFRCVSCGERIDTVILAHRQRPLVRDESESLSPAKRKVAARD